jgi:hypothetical protein
MDNLIFKLKFNCGFNSGKIDCDTLLKQSDFIKKYKYEVMFYIDEFDDETEIMVNFKNIEEYNDFIYIYNNNIKNKRDYDIKSMRITLLTIDLHKINYMSKKEIEPLIFYKYYLKLILNFYDVSDKNKYKDILIDLSSYIIFQIDTCCITNFIFFINQYISISKFIK